MWRMNLMQPLNERRVRSAGEKGHFKYMFCNQNPSEQSYNRKNI